MNSLLRHHEALIAASAIAPSVAEARGYRSVVVGTELDQLSFGQVATRSFTKED